MTHLAAVGLVSILVLALPLPVLAQPDVGPTIDALLACEQAEHAAWSYGFGELNERYEMGTERQRNAASDRINSVLDACEPVTALLPADLGVAFRDDVWNPWLTLARDAVRDDTMVSDVLTSMQNVSSTQTLEDLLVLVADGGATLDARRQATSRRRITSRVLRAQASSAQAAINAANSDLAAWRYEMTAGGGSEARARVAEGTARLGLLRTARRRVLSAMASWRRGAARAGVLRTLASSVDPLDYPSLEAALVD